MDSQQLLSMLASANLSLTESEEDLALRMFEEFKDSALQTMTIPAFATVPTHDDAFDEIKNKFGLRLGYYYYVVPSHKWQPLGIRLGRLMLLFLRSQGVKDAVIERFFECFTNYCKMAIAEYSDLEEDDTAGIDDVGAATNFDLLDDEDRIKAARARLMLFSIKLSSKDNVRSAVTKGEEWGQSMYDEIRLNVVKLNETRLPQIEELTTNGYEYVKLSTILIQAKHVHSMLDHLNLREGVARAFFETASNLVAAHIQRRGLY